MTALNSLFQPPARAGAGLPVRPRLEFKYRITEATAAVVRDYVRSFLTADKFVTDARNFSYPVNSCYLDSRDLTTFWRTVNGAKDRYKLRVRTYDDRADSPVFFEIKRRVGEAIVKSRAAVRREAVDSLLSGNLPQPGDLASSRSDHFLAAERFVRLMQEIDATPTAFVRYQREAWANPGDGTERLTLDREVCVWPTATACFAPPQGDVPARPFGEIVVLEMKFTGAMPPWFRDLEHIAGLRRTSAAKYCDGILKRGLEEFTGDGAAPESAVAFDQVAARLRSLDRPLPGDLSAPAFS